MVFAALIIAGIALLLTVVMTSIVAGELDEVRGMTKKKEPPETLDLSVLNAEVTEIWRSIDSIDSILDDVKVTQRQVEEINGKLDEYNSNISDRDLALLASVIPSIRESHFETDFSEGGTVIYQHTGDGYQFQEVVESAKERYHDVSAYPFLGLIFISFESPLQAPEEITGARMIAVRPRLNRTRIGSNYWVGDEIGWNNE